MKRWLMALSVALSMAFVTSAAFALPTVANVEAAVQKGDYAQAESMMREVVAAKPDSAKGHYIYAEILAHNGRFAEASQQAALARQNDPSIGFTQPDKFRDFEQLLNREQARRASSSAVRPSSTTAAAPALPQRVQEQRSGLPGWIWIVGIGVVGYLVFRMVSRNRAASAMAGPGYGTPYAPGYGPSGGPGGPNGGPGYGQPGYGQPGYGPGYGPGVGPAPSSGPGMMGVGLAAAGGVAAGMLAEKFLERGHEGQGAVRDNSGGGLFDPGSFVDNGADPDARTLEDRSVDFGSGNDWGGGSSSSDSFDSGGGSGGSSDDW
jgi:uncharacterized membrane protein YgcG